MGDFSADWLALRERVDCTARSSGLTGAIAGMLARDGIVRALDVASGTGANVRYLAERLPAHQHWLLVDHDPALLAEVPLRMSEWANRRGYDASPDDKGLLLAGEHLTCGLETRRADLSALDDVNLFAGRALVTASALLDLVSERWLRLLAARCRENNSAALFALVYDGRICCSPEEPEDRVIQDMVNRHQRRDKGFGVAVGPDAALQAKRCFADAGYHVQCESSDWLLTQDTGELQRQLIDGWATAAEEIAPAQSASIRRWRSRRLAHVAQGRSRLVVGHQDLAAWLP